MKRFVFINFFCIFFLSLLSNTALTSAEKDHSDTNSKSEKLKKEAKPDIYTEYQQAQDGLWKDYLKLTDELINGYISGKLQTTYEVFKSRKEALRETYIKGRSELLNKYLNDNEKQS